MSKQPCDVFKTLGAIDPELAEQITVLSESVVDGDSEIPKKYKELILLACAAALRFRAGVRQSGIEAMHHGASEKEITEALALASVTSSACLWSDSIEALADQFTPDAEDPF